MKRCTSLLGDLILIRDRTLFASLKHLNRAGGHDRRYGVFINQLRMAIATQKKAKIIEPRHKPLKFDAVYQKYGHRCLGFADMIEKRILKVLRFFARHELVLLILGRRGRPLPRLTLPAPLVASRRP